MRLRGLDLTESLHDLAILNVYGISFLVAYGLTWIATGLLWTRLGSRSAAFCTLFQGMIALPIALGMSFAIGAFGQERPVDASITELSVYIAMSQLLGLPALIFLIVREMYSLTPYVFAVICSMHFMLYTWLYQTPVYVVMAVAISVGTTVVMLAGREASKEQLASRVSVFTGATMLVTSLILLAVYFAERG